MSDLRQRLDGGEVVVLDGAMGTELEKRGVPMDDAAWSAAALMTSIRPTSATSFGRSPGSRRPGTSKSGGGSCANIPATSWTTGRCRPIDFVQAQQVTNLLA